MENPPTNHARSCTKCRCDLVLGDNWTEASRRNRTYTCRSCNAAKGRAFYAKNSKHVIETAKARRHRNPKLIRDYWQGWRDANPGKASEYTKASYTRTYMDIDRRAAKMAQTCKANCKFRGIEYDLPLEWFVEKLRTGFCEVTGLPFDLSLPPRTQRGCRTLSFAPSIDRIERGGPYTAANVRMVVFIFNVARSDFPDRDLLTLARALLALG